eukprot:m.411765 g.411765  ORF g.411765 m.411765 type:complete len:675 (-) comp16816_c0_seq48:2921-4945(-)
MRMKLLWMLQLTPISASAMDIDENHETESDQNANGHATSPEFAQPVPPVTKKPRASTMQEFFKAAAPKSTLDPPVSQTTDELETALTSTAPTHTLSSRAINATARDVHELINSAATTQFAVHAKKMEMASNSTSTPSGCATVRTLQAEAARALEALGLPQKNGIKKGTHGVVHAKFHAIEELRKYTGVAPEPTFTRSGASDVWHCALCKTDVKISSKKKVKPHCLTHCHLKGLTVTQRDAAVAGAALKEAAVDRGVQSLKMDSLAGDIKIRGCIQAAQKGYSFTSTSAALNLAQSTVDDICDGQDIALSVAIDLKRDPTLSELDGASALEKINDDGCYDNAIRKLRHAPTPAERHVAATLNRLQILRPKSSKSFGPIRLDRTNVSRYVRNQIEPFVDDQVDVLLRKCRYIGLMLDESKSTSKTDPCFIAIVFCTPDFQWGYHLVGQADASICTTGEEHLAGIKKVFVDGGRGWLWDLILLFSTDGCAAMRSTRKYEGLVPRTGTGVHEFGKSFTARLQHELAVRRTDPELHLPELLLGFHCVLHIIALALGDALEILPWHVIPHIRGFHAAFNNQLKMFARLKALCEVAQTELSATVVLLNDPVSDEGLYKCLTFKSYSPYTMERSAESASVYPRKMGPNVAFKSRVDPGGVWRARRRREELGQTGRQKANDCG